MLRWVSPIKYMNRTLTRDIERHGRQLREGEKVLLLYESANFDEAQFAEPERFDVARSPNDHVAFGFGPHYCLGAGLARLEVRVMVERVLARLPDLALAGEIDPRCGGLDHEPAGHVHPVGPARLIPWDWPLPDDLEITTDAAVAHRPRARRRRCARRRPRRPPAARVHRR